jgi:hypothetical protein
LDHELREEAWEGDTPGRDQVVWRRMTYVIEVEKKVVYPTWPHRWVRPDLESSELRTIISGFLILNPGNIYGTPFGWPQGYRRQMLEIVLSKLTFKFDQDYGWTLKAKMSENTHVLVHYLLNARGKSYLKPSDIEILKYRSLDEIYDFFIPRILADGLSKPSLEAQHDY